MPITNAYDAKDWNLTDKKLPIELKPFDGTGAAYKHLSTRVRDFSQTSNSGYRKPLASVQQEAHPLPWAKLQTLSLDALNGHNLADISQRLWMLWGNVLADSIHPRARGPCRGVKGVTA